MGRKKGIMCMGICVAMSLVLLTGCGDRQDTETSGVTQESTQSTEPQTPSRDSTQVTEESQIPKTEKTKIIVRGQEFDTTIRECVALFNEQSDEYVVELDTVTNIVYRFQEETYADLMIGLGADIFTVDSLSDVYSLVNTGIMADLTPYLAASGILEEDYFPFAFDGWREEDKIYGVNVFVQPEGCYIDADFLGAEPHTVESVLTNLQNTSVKTVFRSYRSHQENLTYFLSGSNNLWGMVDEKTGTCNFQGELFRQLVETTYIHSANLGGRPTVAGALMDTYWYRFESEAELEKNGKVRIGYFSDEENHTISSQDNMFLINANSPNTEGAWAFIEFMLDEQAQSLMKYDRYPVSKAVFEKLMAHEIEEGAVMDGEEVVLKAGNQKYYEENGAEDYRARFDLTEEKIAEIRDILETTKATPLKTSSIIKIIAEEFRLYRADDTSVEEFALFVEEKVKQYLDTYK